MSCKFCEEYIKDMPLEGMNGYKDNKCLQWQRMTKEIPINIKNYKVTFDGHTSCVCNNCGEIVCYACD